MMMPATGGKINQPELPPRKTTLFLNPVMSTWSASQAKPGSICARREGGLPEATCMEMEKPMMAVPR